MPPAPSLVKEALEYVRDIENNIPKHFWPELQRRGWLIVEDDGTLNWNYSVTSHVSNDELVKLMVRSKAEIYFRDVGQFKPLPRNIARE